MNRDRLLDLLAVLDETPEENLDMLNWQAEPCGTVGCAVGNYCMARPDAELKLQCQEPVLGSRRGWPAVAEYFGLTLHEAYYLFDSEKYDPGYLCDVPKSAVMARIEQFVADKILAETRP
jgi:hypothetical protein